MLKVLGRATSINVQKVMWCAAELGLEVDRVDVGGPFGGNDQPDYLAKNPNGLVPTLEDGDFVLWESNAIVRYLAETRGRDPWLPADAAGRASAGQWMDWYLSRMHPPMTQIFLALIRTKPEDRDLDALKRTVDQTALLWTIVDKALDASDYLTGEEPTIGDIPVGCSVNRWLTLDLERPPLPNIEAFYERLKERPAYLEHVVAQPMT